MSRGTAGTAQRGQALIEYVLIAGILLGSILVFKAALGPEYWSEFLREIGLYGRYTASFDAIISLPFP